jgi:hypothetical protein
MAKKAETPSDKFQRWLYATTTQGARMKVWPVNGDSVEGEVSMGSPTADFVRVTDKRGAHHVMPIDSISYVSETPAATSTAKVPRAFPGKEGGSGPVFPKSAPSTDGWTWK